VGDSIRVVGLVILLVALFVGCEWNLPAYHVILSVSEGSRCPMRVGAHDDT